MATRLTKATARKMIQRYQQELNSLFEEQEMSKGGRLSSRGKHQYGDRIGREKELQGMYSVSSKGLPLSEYQAPTVRQGKSYPGVNTKELAPMGSLLPEGVQKPGSYYPESTDGFGGGKDLAYDMQLMSPIFYNLMRGFSGTKDFDPEHFYNPYTSDILSDADRAVGTMKKRRYDYLPELQRNLASERTVARDLGRTATSTGQYLSNRGSLFSSRLRADSEVLSRAQNVNNQYLAELANAYMGRASLLGGLGESRSALKYTLFQDELAAQARQGDYYGQASTDLSKLAQVRRRMKMEKERDEELLAIYPDMFKAMMEFSPAMRDYVEKYTKDNYGNKDN